MNYKGIIIEESLAKKDFLRKIIIESTKIEKVTQKHQTPWLKQWTLHTVEVSENQAERTALEIGKSLESKHEWYADYKNEKYHYIIYRDKVFKIDRRNPSEYELAKNYGLSLGIPDCQVSFSPEIKVEVKK